MGNISDFISAVFIGIISIFMKLLKDESIPIFRGRDHIFDSYCIHILRYSNIMLTAPNLDEILNDN